MRGVAVLLVVAFHSQLVPVAGGFVGVDVFFVLSGYLITGILVGEIERSGHIETLRFYGRRMLRLLPAAILVLGCTLVAERLVYSPVERINLSVSGVATALYASNVALMSQATNYFSPSAATDPLLHTWSLGVEEQFYFVWPLVVALGWRATRSRSRLATVFALLAVLSFVGEVWLTHTRQPWAFFAMPARAWEFAIGGIAAIVPMPLGRVTTLVLGWLSLAVTVAAGVGLSGGSAYPGVAVLLPVVGTVGLLVAGAGRTLAGASRILAGAPLRWIGGRSYSWYLWHWPVLIIGTALLGDPAWPARLALVLLSLGAAAATTTLVENPIRFQKQLLTRPALVVVSGLILSTSTATIALRAHRVATARGGVYAAAAKDASVPDRNGCDQSFWASVVHECEFGDTTSSTRVVLIGDSHAAQWFGTLDAIARERHWRLVTMLKWSCPVADVSVYNRVLARRYTECDVWRRSALDRIAAMRPAAVFIAQFAREQKTYDSTNAWVSLRPATWRVAEHTLLARLAEARIPTILFRDSPVMHKRIPECLSRAAEAHQPAATCAVPRSRSVDADFFTADKQAARGLASVGFVDLTDSLCGPSLCDPVRDGLVVYRDGHHITGTFARHLAPALSAQLDAQLTRIGFTEPRS